MFGQAYRLMRATAAVVHGVTRQVCKILPENSVVVLEGSSDDGRKVNVRCGRERLWMFARDWMDRCRSLSLSGVAPLPSGLKLLTAATTDSKNSTSEEETVEREVAASN